MQLLSVVVIALNLVQSGAQTVSKLNHGEEQSAAQERRYLLYGVNAGEGFNLSRDVYMRVANLVRQIRDLGHNFILVLPPWGGLYHWQSRDVAQTRLPWSTFFDVASLNRFVPVIEFEQFLTEHGGSIETILYLQRYEEGWVDGVWQEKWHARPCMDAARHYERVDGRWRGWFWHYGDVVAADALVCVSVQGHSSTLLPLVLHDNFTSMHSLLVDRAETVMHDDFGGVYYWQARRSMRYSAALRRIADHFRATELASTDDADNTQLALDWTTDTRAAARSALGGPYLAVHWRRKDFVRAHGKELPSVNGTALQLLAILHQLNLSTVFVATDAATAEFDELRALFPTAIRVKRYVPPKDVLHESKDGGVSIVDQWISAHARHFVGSYLSTFAFRIHDDREILGFRAETTFNRLCPDNKLDCEQPAQWKLLL